ncbi:hypothetical protein IWZ01DRAFT_512727 [Phyllosticta capitalensis]
MPFYKPKLCLANHLPLTSSQILLWLFSSNLTTPGLSKLCLKCRRRAANEVHQLTLCRRDQQGEILVTPMPPFSPPPTGSVWHVSSPRLHVVNLNNSALSFLSYINV